MKVNIDIDAVIRIPVTEDTLYYNWMLYTKPIHNLTLTEIAVAASLLKHRNRLEGLVSDPSILDREVLGNTVRNEVIKECNITIKHYRMIMTNLRKHKFIIDGRIDKKFIPDVSKERNTFNAVLKFEIKKKK